MSPESASYKEQSEVLTSVVNKLINMTEPDIDELLPLTEQAITAHKAVIDRINMVEKLSETMLKNAQSE